MEYPKIHSLWKRAEGHNFIIGDYSCPEFATQTKWRVQEKIDGTNIRIVIQRFADPQLDVLYTTLKQGNKISNQICDICLLGKTGNAQIPKGIIDWFQEKHFEITLLQNSIFPIGTTILFGEGFGPKIQSGGIYRKDISFILFDVYMCGRWSTREEVDEIAKLLGLESPCDLGLMKEEEIVAFVCSKPKGFYGDKNYTIEGIVARSEPLVRFNNNQANPVMWKLKVKDFNPSTPNGFVGLRRAR